MSQDKVNGHRELLEEQVEVWDSTITTWSHGARDLWKNPKITMIWIEVLVSLVAGILLLLACFGPRRRRSRNWFLQKCVLGAYTLSFSLATYTLGFMQSSEVKSSMYPVWALSLFMLHACTDSMTAYSLDDNIQVTRLRYQAFMYCAYVGLLFTTVQTKSNYILALAYISLIVFIRYLQRLAVCHLAAYSWNLNKTVADYMYGQQNGRVFDPATMEGCNYLVDWPISESKFDASTSYGTQLTVGDHDQVITIEKIWVKSLGPELKDACLSFSLFHLLRRRFFGFVCDESKDRAHEFIFKGLLTDGATDYNRVFKASRARKRAGKPVELPDEVKTAVIGSLKRTSGTLSNGKSSLRYNRAHDLLWACNWELHPDPSWSQRKQNQTHIILTWHIATWYCEMATLCKDRAAKPDVCTSISIATKLSKYCAYLVVSVPKLLPGHHYDTRSKFDAAVVEAIKLPPESTSMYEAMKRLKLPQEPKTIFESGVKLGKQLEELEEVDPWQVMADFLAEMILYLAPSDNVQEHIEQLAQGGEFITHLWALLSHAGILERDHEHQAGEACNQHRVDSFVSAASSFCQCECV